MRSKKELSQTAGAIRKRKKRDGENADERNMRLVNDRESKKRKSFYNKFIGYKFNAYFHVTK